MPDKREIDALLARLKEKEREYQQASDIQLCMALSDAAAALRAAQEIPRLPKMDADSRRILCEWLLDDAKNARECDYSVGIFPKEDIALAFDAFREMVEDDAAQSSALPQAQAEASPLVVPTAGGADDA